MRKELTAPELHLDDERLDLAAELGGVRHLGMSLERVRILEDLIMCDLGFVLSRTDDIEAKEPLVQKSRVGCEGGPAGLGGFLETKPLSSPA